MIIKGEPFYDMATHEIVEFSPRDVDLVFVQAVEIQVVDVLNMNVVDTEYLYVATAVMNDGSIFAAQPFQDRDYANLIAETLAQYCEDVAYGN